MFATFGFWQTLLSKNKRHRTQISGLSSESNVTLVTCQTTVRWNRQSDERTVRLVEDRGQGFALPLEIFLPETLIPQLVLT
jgi:hypothetical protein